MEGMTYGRLFFLDDDEHILQALKRGLRRVDARCTYFSDPEEMLIRARKDNPDLLVSDLHLPGRDITECLRRFREICPGADILLLTGDPNAPELKAIGEKTGLVGTVSKTEGMMEQLLLLLGEPSSVAPGERRTVILDRDIAPLVPGYLKERESLCLQILRDLDQDGFEEIRETGHKIKGSGRLYGFDEISSLGGRIEEAALRNSRDRVREETALLLAYLKRVRYRFE